MKVAKYEVDGSSLDCLLEEALRYGLIEGYEKDDAKVCLSKKGETCVTDYYHARAVLCCLIYDWMVRTQTGLDA